MSTLNVANISDGTDTVETGYVVNGSAKAWVNFDGTGTVAVRDSLNVASVVDNGTGSYATNLSTSMGNSLGALMLGSGDARGNIYALVVSASQITQATYSDAGSLTDYAVVHTAINGDLA
jgi:hypothetical protein